MSDSMKVILMAGVIVILGILLSFLAAYRVNSNFELNEKYKTFLQRCNELNANPYLVLREDIDEFYLKCSKKNE